MSNDRHTMSPGELPDTHAHTTAEAAAAGEDDTWQNEQIVDPDDAQRAADSVEGDDDE
jgi:hypothetical protein